MMVTRKLQYGEILSKLVHAGVASAQPIDFDAVDTSDLDTIEKRVERLMGVLHRKERDSTNMLFFVMYDIESNKVRYQVAKYLIKMGCFRIQRSIFLADLDVQTYDKIKSDLAAVQSCYDNHDSILIVPISTDLLQAMKIIGQNIDIDIITKSKSTLFF